jgi:hypothetical protein
MSKRAREAVGGLPKTIAGAITASFALPDEFEPLRMRNEYSTEETALFKVNEEHKPNWSTPHATKEQLMNNTHVEFLFNDILRNVVRYIRNPNGDNWTYRWVWGRSQAGTDQDNCTCRSGTSSEINDLSHARSTGTFSAHGDVYFALYHGDKRGMWVDAATGATSSIDVTLNVVPTSTQGTILLWVFSTGTWMQSSSQGITLGTTAYTFSIVGSAYYTVQLINPKDNQTFFVNSVGTCGVWSHRYAPGILVNAASIESCRCLGQSILVRNIANPQNRQGNITGIQPGKNRYWCSFAAFTTNNDPYTVVADYAGADPSRQLETGEYGFKKPTEEEDLRFRTPFTIENIAGSVTPVWTSTDSPIMGTEYLVVAMQCTVDAGKDLIIRTVTAGEIETSNQFLTVKKPLAQPEDWRAGIEALASMQQWYDNPIHWQRILKTIGSIASFGGRAAAIFGGDARVKGAGTGIALLGDALQ